MKYGMRTSIFAIVVASCCHYVSAADAPLSDMGPFKKIAEDTLALIEKKDMKGAKTRIKDLEATWDAAEGRLKSVNSATWSSVDKTIDKSLTAVRAAHPDADACSKSLKVLIEKFDAVHKK